MTAGVGHPCGRLIYRKPALAIRFSTYKNWRPLHERVARRAPLVVVYSWRAHMIRPCPACGANNRVPAKHLSDTGRCGSCKATLPPVSEPIEVDATEFTEITRDAKG